MTNSPKRVLIFSTDDFLPPAGGAEIAIGEITKRLPEIDFDLICARQSPQRLRQEKVGNVTIYRLGPGIDFLDKIWLAARGSRKARQLHRQRPYDLVWAVMASYGALAAVDFKRQTGVPYLLTLQEGYSIQEIIRKSWLAWGKFKRAFAEADGLQTISNFLYNWGFQMGFRGRLAQVVPNGVDQEWFSREIGADKIKAERDSWAFGPDKKILITVSRLVEKNGVADVIEALALLPADICLVVCGFGPLEGRLKKKAADLGLTDRVRFLGRVDHDRLPLTLKAADIFIRPSLVEGLGSAFIEAMAAGNLVIGTNVGGIPDFLVDNQTGFICQPANPQSIKAVVLRVKSLSPAEKNKILQTASALVRERYHWPIISEAMRAIFRQLCHRPPAAFILSLDVEGSLGTKGDSRYLPFQSREKEMVERLAALLRRYQIKATWAIAGALWPDYQSLNLPGEMAYHTFSHLDAPTATPEAFVADLSQRPGQVKSFVFPENKVAHLPLLAANGFLVYRGPNQNWYKNFPGILRKLAHGLDNYFLIPAPAVSVRRENGLINIPGSYFYVHRQGWARWLPPSFRVKKVLAGIKQAIRERKAFHLWTHPFNLATDPEGLLSGLEEIFQYVREQREKGVLDNLTLGDFAQWL